MRIAFFSWGSLHSIPCGGLSVAVTELAAALQRLGNEVHVFTRIGNNQSIYQEIDGVHYHRCPFNFNSNLVWEMNNMCKSMVHYFFETKNYIGDFDLIHGHDWMVVNALDEIKKAIGIPTVFTLHSTEYGRDGNHLYDGIAQDIRNLEWYGTYIADRVIVCSNAMKNEIQWLYQVPDWKIRIVPNGIWASRFDGEVDAYNDVKKHFGFGVYDPLAVFVGRMTVQKGVDLLIQAIPAILQEFPNAKFVFIGDGPQKHEYERMVSEMNLWHAVRFTGYIDNEWKTKIMKAADCIVVPSRNEPFGIVVLEGWACRKPVVATHGTGAGELIWHEVTGLKVYQAPNSIAWGIKEIFRNPERAKWMGENGRRAAEEVFTWDNAAKKTIEVYEELVRR